MKKNKLYILGWRTASNAAVTLWKGYDADEAKKAFDAADFADGIYFIELWEETTVNTRHDYKMKEGGANLMKSCFDGYLTPECADCSFWCNGEDLTKGIGCNIPFPIDHCEAFNKMYKEENKGALDDIRTLET